MARSHERRIEKVIKQIMKTNEIIEKNKLEQLVSDNVFAITKVRPSTLIIWHIVVKMCATGKLSAEYNDTHLVIKGKEPKVTKQKESQEDTEQVTIFDYLEKESGA